MLVDDAVGGSTLLAPPWPGTALRRPAVPLLPAAALLLVVRGVDLLAAVFAGWLAALVLPRFGVEVSWQSQLLLALSGGLVALAACSALGGYASMGPQWSARRLAIQGTSVALGGGAILGCGALLPGTHGILPTWPALWMLAFAATQASSQALLNVVVDRWRLSGRLTERVAVVGLNELSAGFLDQIARQRTPGISVVGLYHDDHDIGLASHAGHRVIGHVSEVVARSRNERIDAVVLAMPLTHPDRISVTQQVVRSMIADVYLVAGLPPLSGLAEASANHSFLMFKLGSRPLTAWQRLQKTALDKIISMVLLVLLAPLLAGIALLIKIDSPGPVLFHQPRLGFNNSVYTVFKFRTMFHKQADILADKQTTRGDPRITRVGRILRRFSLDELPQLANVLGGSMSLVGPRPHAPNTKAGDLLFHDAVADYAMRHRVKPGITGWAQVNGWRGETKTRAQIEHRVQHDLFYIDNWSIWLDYKILFLTAIREIFSKVAF